MGWLAERQHRARSVQRLLLPQRVCTVVLDNKSACGMYAAETYANNLLLAVKMLVLSGTTIMQTVSLH